MKRITAIIDEKGVRIMRKYRPKGRFNLYDGYRFHGNWDRGAYFMMADISNEQFIRAMELYKKHKLAATKEYLESITGRNFEAEND